MKKKFLALFVTLVMVSTALSACGGSKDKKEADNSAAQNKTEMSSTDNKSDAAPADNSAADKSDTADNSDAADTADTSGDDLMAQLKERFTIGYCGAGDDDSELYWAVDENVSSGIFLIISPDKTQAISLVGNIEEVDGEWLKITDEQTGNEATIKVEQIADNQIQLTKDDGSFAILQSVPADQVIDKMFEIAG